MNIDRLDHLVLIVRDIEAACAFYTKVLGMKEVIFDGRKALAFGNQKINLHEYGIPAVSDRTNSFDMTFFGGADIAGPLIAEYSLGYRLVGNMNDFGGPFYNGDIGNDFRVTAAPGFSLANGVINTTFPISYLLTTAGYSGYPNEGYIDIDYNGLTAGVKSTYTFGKQIYSTITVRADFLLKGRNINKDYYIGAGYSAVVPF